MKPLSAAALTAAVAGSLCLLSTAAHSSVVFNLEKETITINNDGIGTVGVQVASCRAESQLLWDDPKVATPWGSSEPSTASKTYGIEETGFGPTISAVIARLDKWRKLSISEKVKAADPRDRDTLGRYLRQPCPGPSQQSSSRTSSSELSQGRTDVYLLCRANSENASHASSYEDGKFLATILNEVAAKGMSGVTGPRIVKLFLDKRSGFPMVGVLYLKSRKQQDLAYCYMGKWRPLREEAWSSVHSGLTDYLNPALKRLFISVPER